MTAQDARHRLGSARGSVSSLATLSATVVLALWLLRPARAEPGEQVAACDTLVSLRIVTAGAPDRASALTRVAGQPGCRTVARADVGAVEHRAMIGGAPFECLAVKGAPACLWVQP